MTDRVVWLGEGQKKEGACGVFLRLAFEFAFGWKFHLRLDLKSFDQFCSSNSDHVFSRHSNQKQMKRWRNRHTDRHRQTGRQAERRKTQRTWVDVGKTTSVVVRRESINWTNSVTIWFSWKRKSGRRSKNEKFLQIIVRNSEEEDKRRWTPRSFPFSSSFSSNASSLQRFQRKIWPVYENR